MLQLLHAHVIEVNLLAPYVIKDCDKSLYVVNDEVAVGLLVCHTPSRKHHLPFYLLHET